MLFNSFDFAVFLPFVFLIYWNLNLSIRKQNFLLLLASYTFYGWWDWKFLSLIILSSFIDFFIGKKMNKITIKNQRKKLLYLSIFFNLGTLFVFKYYNFFIESFSNAFSFFGHDISVVSLNIILPVGISFYTFQTLSYSIDVYRGKIKSTSNIINFFAFVSFFPQLVAGPIERASHLLPQFENKRKFNYNTTVSGLRQILWGLFKKIVIADNSAEIANQIFNNYPDYSGSTLVVGAIFFSIQIYGDFSGYSDIAIGTAKLFGFDLMKNFSFPYFSRNIGEFWRRWHISLSTWFRDYVYIPLGGSMGSKWLKIRNIFIIFIVSGFWHGANWTYLFWGALNALYFIPSMLLNKNRSYTNNIAENRLFPKPIEFIGIIKTFSITVFAWIFFRSESVTDAFLYIKGIFDSSLFTMPEIRPFDISILILFFFSIEWLGRHNEFAIEKINHIISKKLEFSFYLLIGLFIYIFQGQQQDFIYFQF